MDSQFFGYMASFILGVLTFAGGLVVSRASARNYDSKTIETLYRQVKELVTDREQDRKEIERYQKLINDIEERVDYFEQVWVEVKKWFDDFRMWAEERQITDYPAPPKSLSKDRDTKDKMRSVK